MDNSASDNLFICVYPEGMGYADRSRQEDGDYARLAFFAFKDLSLEFEPGCPPHLADIILRDAQEFRARRNEAYPISASGQTVQLGSKLAQDAMPETRFKMAYNRRDARSSIEVAVQQKMPAVAIAMLEDANLGLDTSALNYLICEMALLRADVEVMRAALDRRSLTNDLASHQHPGGLANALGGALSWAAHNDDLALMELLVERGASTTYDDSTAVRAAAHQGHADAIRWLVDHGADPCARGNQALQQAAARDRTDVIRALLEVGAGDQARPAWWSESIVEKIAAVEAEMSQQPAPGC
jgi:hypothetical protein